MSGYTSVGGRHTPLHRPSPGRCVRCRPVAAVAPLAAALAAAAVAAVTVVATVAVVAVVAVAAVRVAVAAAAAARAGSRAAAAVRAAVVVLYPPLVVRWPQPTATVISTSRDRSGAGEACSRIRSHFICTL